MRHKDRKTLGASIAAHLSWTSVVDPNTPNLSWNKKDVLMILDDLTRMVEEGDKDKANEFDKRIRAGGTAYKWAIWSAYRDNRLRMLIAGYAMEQRPEANR